MIVIIPHHTTQDKAIALVDKSANDLFDIGGGSVEISNRTKNWTGPRMDFSLTAGVGFISLPISGNVLVDPVNVTVDVELPAIAKNFIGEDKIRASLEKRMQGILAPPQT